jgi:hypothetical protein
MNDLGEEHYSFSNFYCNGSVKTLDVLKKSLTSFKEILPQAKKGIITPEHLRPTLRTLISGLELDCPIYFEWYKNNCNCRIIIQNGRSGYATFFWDKSLAFFAIIETDILGNRSEVVDISELVASIKRTVNLLK